jgi:hypothetical protein
MIPVATDGERSNTSACHRGIYMDRAMPEHITRALAGSLVLSLLLRRLVLVHSVRLHF